MSGALISPPLTHAVASIEKVPPTPLQSPNPRIPWIDLLRGIAVLTMIAGHAADAFMADRWRDAALWHWVNIGLGFVAPAFLLLSGISLWLAMQRHGGTARPALWARAGVILALGYWLQIPVLSLRQLVWNQRPAELARLFDSNILHAIAFPALFVLALLVLVRSRRTVRVVAATAAVAIAITAPIIPLLIDPFSIPIPLRAFVSTQPVATFPLLPFAAYHLLGFAIAPWLIRDDRPRIARWIVLAGAALAIVGVLWGKGMTAMTFEAFWRDSLPHTLFRLGGTVLAAGLAMIVGHTLPARARRLFEWFGRRALAVYVLHLVLIYGSPMTMGSRYWFDAALNRALDPLETTMLWSLSVVLVASALRLWEHVAATHPRPARLLAWGWWLTFAALFLGRP